MHAVFVELPAFARYREHYLDDAAFVALQSTLMLHPHAGDLIQGTGGLRKLRWSDPRRGKGKRGGLRIIYYWWEKGAQCWLFTLYDKNEMADLGAAEKTTLKSLLKTELDARP